VAQLVVAVATKCTGDEADEPFVGELTETLAIAGNAIKKTHEMNDFMFSSVFVELDV